MLNLPFGRWHPDAEAINAPIVLDAKNVRAVAAGFAPVGQPVSASNEVGICYITEDDDDLISEDDGTLITLTGGAAAEHVIGAVALLDSSANVRSFAGTETELWELSSNPNWVNVTRTSGGDYSTASSERWDFAEYGDYIIATNFTDNVQVLDTTGSSPFADLSGSPPKARHAAVVRDFLVLGHLAGDRKTVHWSGINDITDWSIGGAGLSDVQTMPEGGPIQGLVGGEVGYIFQREAVTRMAFLPNTAEIFSFDRIETGRGLYAPYSLVQNASEAFYYGSDGLYRMSLITGVSRPIGVGKFREWLQKDIMPNTERKMFASLSPNQPIYALAYVSASISGTQDWPNRILLYDWTLDEASYLDLSTTTLVRWLTGGVTLEGLDAYGDLDSLAFSLDSPAWQGGVPLLGTFGLDYKLSHLNGTPMEACFVTADGQQPGRRSLITATRPHIDTTTVTVEIAARERDGDTVDYRDVETMSDTGSVPAWASGNYARARVVIPEGSTWTLAKGIQTTSQDMGDR